MILLLNGAFGIGKTTVARLLVPRLPRAILFDPEIIGIALQRTARLAGRGVDDFQDLPSWRRLTIAGLRATRMLYPNIVVPMAFSNVEYLEEIRRGIGRFESEVFHFCLVAPEAVVHERQRARHTSSRDAAWQQRRASECCQVHERDEFATHVVAVDRDPAEIADEILRGVRPAWNRSHGLVYIADGDSGPLSAAEAGATFRMPEGGPPWIVVDHSVDSLIAARWPGRLWRVEILKKAREQPRADANYTRATTVRVIERMSVAVLFGSHGQQVCDVIERAGSLTVVDATILGEALHPAARETYSEAWNRWLGRTNENHTNTLAIVSESGGARSPIGTGPTVLQSTLSERARSLCGDAAFIVDDQGDQSLAAPWDSASEALQHAALAFGAPDLLSPPEAQILTAAWTKLCED